MESTVLQYGIDQVNRVAFAIQPLFSGQTTFHERVVLLLKGFVPEKKLKGKEYVAALGELYAKLLFGGNLENESHEHDLTTLDGQRLSVKTRVGTGRGWSKTSAIPAIDSPGGPTGLVFVSLNADYTPRKIWLYDWQELVKNERFKPHMVRGRQRSYVFFVSEEADRPFLRYECELSPTVHLDTGPELVDPGVRDDLTHWHHNRRIVEAGEALGATLDRGQRHVTLDLHKLQKFLHGDDTPAYDIMNAMYTIRRDEGLDGFRGAPRVLLAFAQLLIEHCTAEPEELR